MQQDILIFRGIILKSRDTVVEGLADKLASARKAAGLSQVQASEATGIKQTNISVFERGKKTPTLATLIKLAKAYGVDPCDLIPKEEPKPEPAPAKKPKSSKSKK